MYQSYPPPRELSPFVECFWHWSSAAGQGEQTHLILPDAAPELIIHLGSAPHARSGSGGWQPQAAAFLYCSAYRCLELQITQPMDVFAIRFKPWGLSRFSRQPMSNLLDRPVPPGDALDALGESLVDAVQAHRDDTDRVSRLGETLIEALAGNPDKGQSIQMLLQALGSGGSPAQALADGLARSSRTVRRVWRDLVGISPRTYQKLMRFHRALALIEKKIPLSAVAAECGFADQPHMARQIKELSGLAPSRLRSWLGEEIYQGLYAGRPEAPWNSAAPPVSP